MTKLFTAVAIVFIFFATYDFSSSLFGLGYYKGADFKDRMIIGRLDLLVALFGMYLIYITTIPDIY